MTEGRKRYHGDECKIVDVIYEMQALAVKPESHSKNLVIVEVFSFLRAIIEPLSIAGSPYVLRDLMTPPENKAAAENFDIRKMNGETNEMKQLQIVNLLNSRNEDTDPNVKSVLDRYIDYHPKFAEVRKHEDLQKFFKEFADRSVRILSNNGIAYGHGDKTHGRGVLPFCSLFNHSCDPNVSFVLFNNKFAFVVVKPIAKDEQLFIDYV
jgi:hypothetical protein